MYEVDAASSWLKEAWRIKRVIGIDMYMYVCMYEVDAGALGSRRPDALSAREAERDRECVCVCVCVCVYVYIYIYIKAAQASKASKASKAAQLTQLYEEERLYVHT
jgi:hypothetical protein